MTSEYGKDCTIDGVTVVYQITRKKDMSRKVTLIQVGSFANPEDLLCTATKDKFRARILEHESRIDNLKISVLNKLVK